MHDYLQFFNVLYFLIPSYVRWSGAGNPHTQIVLISFAAMRWIRRRACCAWILALCPSQMVLDHCSGYVCPGWSDGQPQAQCSSGTATGGVCRGLVCAAPVDTLR